MLTCNRFFHLCLRWNFASGGEQEDTLSGLRNLFINMKISFKNSGKKWRILLAGYVGSNLSIPRGRGEHWGTHVTPWLSHLSIPRRIFYWKKNLDQVRDHKQATVYTSTWMSKT
ncbi:hypothetical protein HanPI659440_Chr11g0424251 [Helianthus annuus]|nr:hypothetical protein HanIR_Chr11g0532261 [Helianthus annuus]KAJ0734778.1 hypothetical protein HanPI659440_Chr11g0424251 [Helianthus annuus]